MLRHGFSFLFVRLTLEISELMSFFYVGVMRFLQMEWQAHERARNAWDIERAEMKAKIAKQEGDGRKAKKLNEQLDKQIRMLEKALRSERAKNSGNKATGENGDGAGVSSDAKNGVSSDKGPSAVKGKTYILQSSFTA